MIVERSSSEKCADERMKRRPTLRSSSRCARPPNLKSTIHPWCTRLFNDIELLCPSPEANKLHDRWDDRLETPSYASNEISGIMEGVRRSEVVVPRIRNNFGPLLDIYFTCYSAACGVICTELGP